MKINGNRLVLLIISVILGVSLVVKLGQIPPIWFDEGWIMSVAKNWMENGHYGLLLNGEPVPTCMLNIGFPVIGPIAASFAIFGVGVWQGRLPSVLFTAGSFLFIYCLARSLYDRRIAAITLLVALLVPCAKIHPITYGRQALGEMPAVFYLLGGYFFFSLAWRYSLSIILAALFWALAMVTKQQVVPFLVTALFIPLLVLIINKNLKQASIVAFTLIGMLIMWHVMLNIQQTLVSAKLSSKTQMELYFTTAIVPVAAVRLRTLVFTMLMGAPAVFGLGYAFHSYIKKWPNQCLEPNVQIIRLSLLVLTSTWLAWYTFLSVGWIRYLFPPTFISTIFFSAFLNELINEPKFNHFHAIISIIYKNKLNIITYVAIAILGISIIANHIILLPPLFYKLLNNRDATALEVAHFINSHTSDKALIETYDMELFVLLKRRYHYPPDWVQLRLNRRFYLGEDVQICYNPLQADPDYLIVGPFSKTWRLYDKVLETKEFKLIRQFQKYQVYLRVRKDSP